MIASVLHRVRDYYDLKLGYAAEIVAQTGDGWALPIAYYPAHKGAGRGDNRIPVICCHGVAASRYSFDMGVDHSLSQFLARRGHDVYVMELRGHGQSKPPKGQGGFFQAAYDYQVLLDVPAVIAEVQGHSGAQRVHWIGHSMGGIVGYGYMSRLKGVGLQSAIMLAACLDYSESASGYHGLRPYMGLLRAVQQLPLGALGKAAAPFVGRFGAIGDRFNFWLPNVEPALVRRYYAHAYGAVSADLLRQLASAFEPGGLTTQDGDICYLDGLCESTIPVLAVSGSRDMQCHQSAVVGTLEKCGGQDKKHLCFGTEFGQQEEYGHVDLLLGRRAQREVFPAIADWLLDHDV